MNIASSEQGLETALNDPIHKNGEVMVAKLIHHPENQLMKAYVIGDTGFFPTYMKSVPTQGIEQESFKFLKLKSINDDMYNSDTDE